jgi:hypothetical protein
LQVQTEKGIEALATAVNGDSADSGKQKNNNKKQKIGSESKIEWPK